MNLDKGSSKKAIIRFKHYHNQPADSVLHRSLQQLWTTVATETQGRFEIELFPENSKIVGGDTEVIRQLLDGRIEFYAQMGGLFSSIVPVADAQGIPFAFQNRTQVFSALDGDLGDFIRTEMRAKGLHALPKACFENGFHHITLANRRVRSRGDMDGLTIRTPNSRIFIDFFETLGALPRSINVDQMYESLRTKAVEAQQNPLAVIELFKLYEIQSRVALTGHIWSGFNLVANLEAWNSIPSDIQNIIERNAAKFALRQRAEQEALNEKLRQTLGDRGMTFDQVDIAGFKGVLGPFYARWKANIGGRAWSLLENHVGRIA
jgi:tripartite ATP-independent transporter DctP family solute receptor